jgi:MFS family permease
LSETPESCYTLNMSANVNENLSSTAASPETQTEAAAVLSATQPRDVSPRLGQRLLNRFVVAGPWSALAYRDFRLLWSGLLISQAGTQMRIVAVAWQVFLLSGSALQIGALGLFQAIPTMVFSLVGGVIADAVDRRKLLLFTEVTLAICSVALALLTIFHLITVPIIYGIAFVSSAVGSFDYPTRQALISKIVPHRQLTNAYSLNILMFNLAIIVGPTLGGLAIAGLGVAGTYWFDVGSFGCVIIALLLMRVDGRPGEGRAAPGLQSLVEGMQFLRRHPVILSVMLLDFCTMFFGSTRSLLPIYAANIYHVGPQGLGLLLAATGVGAVLAAFLTGPVARVRRQGLGILIAIVAYGGCVLLFGLSSWSFALGLFFLAAAGAADMISTVLRSAIVQLGTPDDFRGRVSSVNAVFAIGGPMLGQFEAGALANVSTAPIAAAIGGLVVIAGAGFFSILVPGIRRFLPIPKEHT